MSLPGQSFAQRRLAATSSAVYVQQGRGIAAIRADSGRTVWESDSNSAPADLSSGLLVTPTRVLARYESNVQALDIATGAPVWTRSSALGVTGLASDGTRAYIASGNWLSAVTVTTGVPEWSIDSTTVCDLNPCAITGVIASGDTVLFLTASGGFNAPAYVRAVRGATGVALWSVAAVPLTAAIPPFSAPSATLHLAGSTLVLSDLYSGLVMGVDRVTPRVVWSRVHGTTDVLPFFPVDTHGDTVFVSGRSGGTVAIAASTGTTRWQQLSITTATTLTACGGRLLMRTFPSLFANYWVLRSGDGSIRGAFGSYDFTGVADPAAAAGRVFIGTVTALGSSPNASLVALDCSRL